MRRAVAASAAAEEAEADTVEAELAGQVVTLPAGAVLGDGTASCPSDYPIDPKSTTMSRQIPSSSLAVTLSTKRVVLPARMVHQVATLAGFEGLDVDVTTSLGRWLGARLAASDLRNVPVRSLWVPAGDIHSPASRRLIGDIANRQSDSCLSVVATLPAGATLNELATHFALQEGVHNSLPVALGLPSTALKGGRPHLVQLGVIRRFAEEWNLSVAIDLSGQLISPVRDSWVSTSTYNGNRWPAHRIGRTMEC